MAVIDWDAVKTEYITTDASQSELAKKYGCKRSTVGERCRKEKWVEGRGKYRASLVQKAIDLRAREDANHLSELLSAAEMITGIAVEALTNSKHLYTYQVERRERYTVPIDSESGDIWSEDTDGVPIAERQWTEDRVSDAINTRALKDLASIVKEMTGLIRDFYDLPTAAQREQRDINLARLRMDEKKANREENEDRTITLVIPPELEGLGD